MGGAESCFLFTIIPLLQLHLSQANKNSLGTDDPLFILGFDLQEGLEFWCHIHHYLFIFFIFIGNAFFVYYKINSYLSDLMVYTNVSRFWDLCGFEPKQLLCLSLFFFSLST